MRVAFAALSEHAKDTSKNLIDTTTTSYEIQLQTELQPQRQLKLAKRFLVWPLVALLLCYIHVALSAILVAIEKRLDPAEIC